MDLLNTQWSVIEPLVPKPVRRVDGKGRPRRDARDVLNGVLWILRTEAQWADLPDRYPPYQTCHRHFQAWCKAGITDEILKATGASTFWNALSTAALHRRKRADRVGKTKPMTAIHTTKNLKHNTTSNSPAKQKEQITRQKKTQTLQKKVESRKTLRMAPKF